MAFEFLSNALRGAVDFFGGLGGEVGNGRANDEDDVRKVKRAMATLGRVEEPEDEPSGIIDRPLDTAIRGFQRDKGLRVDGFMRPEGPTERSLQSDLFGFLRDEGERGSGSALSGFSALNPAAALRAERSSGSSKQRDDQNDQNDRLFRSSDSHASSTREFRSDRKVPATTSLSRAAGMAADVPSVELEPARLKPFLDKAERNLRRMVDGWRKEGMTDAARHLQHFLDGSGEPITYNRDQARSFGPVRDAEEDAQKLLREEILERARDLKDGESRAITEKVTGQHRIVRHGLGLLRGLLGDTDRFNDNLAIGRTPVESTFRGTISRRGDEISVEGAVDNTWNDRYDFHSGQLGADAALSIQKYRGAKPFGFGGSWRQRLSGAIERRGDRVLPRVKFADVD